MTDFPIENLPFGVFNAGGEPHICTAIEDRVLDLHACAREGLLEEATLLEPLLNGFMARNVTARVKKKIRELLAGNVERHLLPMKDLQMLLPARIGDYTDF